MSGHAEVLFILAAFNSSYSGDCLSSVFKYLVKQHHYTAQLDNDVSGLLFSEGTNGFIATSINTRNKTLVEIQKESPWLRLEGLVTIGEVVDFAEVYLYPVENETEQCGLSISLGSSFYDSIYDEDGFDEEAKQALIGFCLGVANTAKSDGFVLVFDDEQQRQLGQRNVLKIRSDLLLGSIEELKREPKLITGIRNNFVLKEEVEAVWGKEENIYETTNGYIILDILLPDESE